MADGRKLRGISGNRVVRALGKAGWYVSTQEGSHAHLRSDNHPGLVVTVPIHRGKPVHIKTLRRILSRAGLTVEEFERLFSRRKDE